MSSEDECLSPLMSIRPLKNSVHIRTPLLPRLEKPPSTNVTPLNTIFKDKFNNLKTPDTASNKKLSAAFLFSSCKKNTGTDNTPRHTVLVGDSSDDEEQFQDSFKHLTSDKGSSYAVEDSITEFSLIRKWLINAEDSEASSASETENSEGSPNNSLQKKQSNSSIPTKMNKKDESIILLSSSDDEGTNLEFEWSNIKQKGHNSIVAPAASEEEVDSSGLCDSSLNASPPIMTLQEKFKSSKHKQILADTSSSEEEVPNVSFPKQRGISTTEIIETPEKDTNELSKQFSQSPTISRFFESPKCLNFTSLENKLSNLSLKRNSTIFAARKVSENTSRFFKSPAQDDMFVESSDEENLMPLSSKLSTLLKREQPNDKLTEGINVGVKLPLNTDATNREKIFSTKLPTQSKIREDVDSNLEDVFADLSITETPISKPKKIPRPHRKRVTVIDSDDDVKHVKSGGQATFLSSLSADIPQELRHPEAMPFVKGFKKTRDELTRRLFYLFNEVVFDNQLQRDFSITWNNRLTRTAGYCRHFTRREEGVTFFESRIELSSKVVDTPCRLRDTLVHELCHAATWTIDNCRGGHGPVWRKWANRALHAFPELPPITRCHNYEITYKFYYNCVVCSFSTGRHSKSVDTTTHVCPMCRGRLELSKEPNKSVASSGRSEAVATTPAAPKTPKTRTPNAFAMFVKDNYAAVKASRSDMPHAAVMKVLSAKFAEFKKQSVL